MSSTTQTFNIMEQAPVVIIILQTCEWGGISAEIQSVSAAIQNMLLKIHSMGLGAVWINDVLFVEPAILRLLNVKEEESEFVKELTEFANVIGIKAFSAGPLVAAIALGYPNEDPKREPRKTVDEITTWYE